MEIAAVLTLEKPLVFSCGKVSVRGGGAGGEVGRVEVVRGGLASCMLANCSELVDVAGGQCAVQADRERELATIGEANFGAMNRTVAAALGAGATAAHLHVSEVDAFNCGEPGPLRVMEEGRVGKAFHAACSAGQMAVLVELREARAEAVAAYLAGVGEDEDGGWLPVWLASLQGRLEVVKWLLNEVGASAGAVQPMDGSSAVCMAAQNGHLEVVRVLIEAGASVDQAMEDGRTPLFLAAMKGHVEVVRALVEVDADKLVRTCRGDTALSIAQYFGHKGVVDLLRS